VLVKTKFYLSFFFFVRDKREKESDVKPHVTRDKPKAVVKETSLSVSLPPVTSQDKDGEKLPAAVEASEDDGLTKAQLKRRRKKALVSQKKEEDTEEYSKGTMSWDDLAKRRRNVEGAEEREQKEDKVWRKIDGLDKGINGMAVAAEASRGKALEMKESSSIAKKNEKAVSQRNEKKCVAQKSDEKFVALKDEEIFIQKNEEKLVAQKKKENVQKTEEKLVAQKNKEKAQKNEERLVPQKIRVRLVPKNEERVTTQKSEEVVGKKKDDVGEGAGESSSNGGEDSNALTFTMLTSAMLKGIAPSFRVLDQRFFDSSSMEKFMECDKIVNEAVKSALAKKKAAKGKPGEEYTCSMAPQYEDIIEDLATSFAEGSLFHDKDDENDDGIKGMEEFLTSPSPLNSLPIRQLQKQIAEASGFKVESNNTAGKVVLSSSTTSQTSRIMVRYPKPPGSQDLSHAASEEESGLAKSAQGVPSVKAMSGIMGVLPTQSDKSSQDGACATSSTKPPKKVDSKLGDTQGEECIAKLAEKLSGPGLSGGQFETMLNDFSNLSLPVLNDLSFQSQEGGGKTKTESKSDVKEKKEKKKKETRGKKKANKDKDKKENTWTEVPEFNKLISVLADPFGIARTSNLPTKGALTFYMQETSRVRPPNTKKIHSAAESATQHLLDLVKNATRGNVQHHCDCNFHLVEFGKLPTVMRRMASRENTGAVLENVEISVDEFREVLTNTKMHGKRMYYTPEEPVTRLMILCFPLELGLPKNSLVNLGRDAFGVAEAITVTYKVKRSTG